MPEQKEHLLPPRNYLVILIALMGLLLLTVLMAFVNIDRWTTAHHLGSGWNTGVALAIAVAKGLLVLLVFMHVRYGSRLTWIFAAAGFVWLGIMFWLTMTDYLTRGSHKSSGVEDRPAVSRSE